MDELKASTFEDFNLFQVKINVMGFTYKHKDMFLFPGFPLPFGLCQTFPTETGCCGEYH